ncbi:MAG TPA: hypothetical protein V6C88_18160 [Chroococcidiopsis sp.]
MTRPLKLADHPAAESLSLGMYFVEIHALEKEPLTKEPWAIAHGSFVGLHQTTARSNSVLLE